MKKIINSKQLLLLLVLFTGSCNEDIMNYKDQVRYTTDAYFNTPEEIEKGATAIYSSFYFNSMFAWRWPEALDVLANEVKMLPPAEVNEVDILSMSKYQYNNTTNPVVGLWRLCYKMVLRSNLVIDKANAYLNDPARGDNAIVKRSLGEAHFLRGWAYTQLAFYFGRVPLRTTFNQAGNEDAPRSATVKEVWDIAEADFMMAKELLPEVSNYRNGDADSKKMLGRATREAATGFLGKLYLYNKEYAKADAEFALLEGKHSLLPLEKWMDNFDEINENNVESIFEVQFHWFAGGVEFGMFGDGEGEGTTETNTAHMQLYTWPQVGGWDNYGIPQMRVNDFQYKDEAGNDFIDPRAPLTFYGGIGDNTILDKSTGGAKPYTFANTNPQIYYYKKYTMLEYRRTTIQSGINFNLMRYADVILMRAECKLKTGDIPGCIALINQVRDRVGAFRYTGNYSETQAFDLLKRERQIEFMGEQVRYNDLIRWGILEETLNPELQILLGNQPVTTKHYLFPIPQLEIDTNLGLGAVENNWN